MKISVCVLPYTYLMHRRIALQVRLSLLARSMASPLRFWKPLFTHTIVQKRFIVQLLEDVLYHFQYKNKLTPCLLRPAVPRLSGRAFPLVGNVETGALLVVCISCDNGHFLFYTPWWMCGPGTAISGRGYMDICVLLFALSARDTLAGAWCEDKDETIDCYPRIIL